MVRIDTATAGNLYFHQMTFTEPGDLVPTHRHTYPHVLQVQQGTVRLYSETDGIEELTAPAVKVIPAGIAHDVESLTPAIACCIHEMRDAEGQIYPFAYERTTREVAAATARM
jgi:quercetin dioxygenase-like cupin family protein